MGKLMAPEFKRAQIPMLPGLSLPLSHISALFLYR
ncbi:Uncharacterised protein [Bordetella pertussis]|nr:Uncharacterised protein [Bordetella pertussis]